MNNDDLINNVLREYGYEGLIDSAESTSSIVQTEGGTITAPMPLQSNQNALPDNSDDVEAVEVDDEGSDAPPEETTFNWDVDHSEQIDALAHLRQQIRQSLVNGDDTEDAENRIPTESEYPNADIVVTNVTESNDEFVRVLADAMAESGVGPTFDDDRQAVAESINEYVEETGDTSVSPIQLNENPEYEEVIPLNDIAYDIDEKTLRFSGADWYEDIQQKTIILAGLGGIGSWTAMMLSRMHPLQIILYDDDIIDATNLAGQLYSQDMVGKSKVDSIADLMKNFSDYKSTVAIQRRIVGDPSECVGPIMICGFDNMEARKTFFDKWYSYIHTIPSQNLKDCLFVDGRLNMEEFQIFCIQGNDSYHISEYVNNALFDDSKAESAICSMKQTTYCSAMIGALIANLIVNFITNKEFPMRNLPYFTYYNANMMYFKTQTQ